MPEPSAAELLAAFDAQLRGDVPDRLPEGVHVERDGPLLSFVGMAGGGFVDYRDLGGCEGAELDELIARRVLAFSERGESFEWKAFGHDRPEDLPERLRSAGLQPEDEETVLIALVDRIAAPPQLPDGVSLRAVGTRRDFERIEALKEEIWQDDRSWLADSLEAEQAADPDALVVVVAEAGEELVCAAWVRFARGTEFATLWGGGTSSAWRGRGIYRATVAHRANLAAARGCRYLQVDASADSRPILERLGFVAVTSTTPYVWSPSLDRDRRGPAARG